MSISFNGIPKKQAKENVFIANNKKYFPIAKDINKQLEEIKLIDIKLISREKKDLILDEISSLKYLTNIISKINHMFASKISVIYQWEHRNKKYITLNDTFSSSFGINSDYLLNILMDFEFIAVSEVIYK